MSVVPTPNATQPSAPLCGVCESVPAPVSEQSAVPQDRGRQRIAVPDEVVDGDRLAALDARDQAEVGGGEQADVVGVLTIDALEAFSDDQAHAGRALGDHAVLARAALAVALARHHHLEAAASHAVGLDGQRISGLESDVGKAAQRRIEMHHHRQRRDLVGGDVVAQRPRVVQQDALAGELCPHDRGFGAEVQRAGMETKRVHAHAPSPALSGHPLPRRGREPG
jgi:hypothetical protein